MGLFEKLFRKKQGGIGAEPDVETVSDKIKDYLGCECELFVNEKDPLVIFNCYKRLYEEGKEKGFTPVIIAVDDTLLEKLNFFEEDYGKMSQSTVPCLHENRTLANADHQVNPADGLGEKQEESDKGQTLSEMLERLDEVDDSVFLEELLNQYDEEMRLPLQEDMSCIDRTWIKRHELKLTTYCNVLTKKVLPEVLIAKVPIQCPWELPLWIPMGGYNDCPPPDVQAAVFRRWYKKYGATPAVVGHDTWELIVERPPQTEEEALELAKELYIFDYDILSQGYGEIGIMAADLIDNPVWYFWWD